MLFWLWRSKGIKKQGNEDTIGNGAEKRGMKILCKTVTLEGEEVAEGLSES